MKCLFAALALFASSSAFAQATTSQTAPYAQAVVFAARGHSFECRAQSFSQVDSGAFAILNVNDLLSLASAVEVTGGATPALKFSTVTKDSSKRYILSVSTNADYTEIKGMQLTSQDLVDVNLGNMQNPNIAKGYATVITTPCY